MEGRKDGWKEEIEEERMGKRKKEESAVHSKAVLCRECLKNGAVSYL